METYEARSGRACFGQLHHQHVLAAIIIALGLALGCSSGSNKPAPAASEAKPAAAAPRPTEMETGREAFQRLYVMARGWAPDAGPFRLQSQFTTDANGQGGKAAVWRAFFASASRRALKPYIWSGSSASGAPERGITPGPEDTYNPANTSTQPFDLRFLKIDSDKAFSVAQEHGGAKIIKAKPDQSVTYLLDWDAAHNRLVWHVIYGPARADAKLVIAVDAGTGAFIHVEQ